MIRYCHPLSDTLSAATVGQKASQLSFLFHSQVETPPGFAISTNAFDDFLAVNNLRDALCWHQIAAYQNTAALTTFSLDIKSSVKNGTIPDAFMREIKAGVHALPTDQVIVRSSAIGEDGKEASFAGQLESFITSKTDNEIAQAVKSCWASYWNDHCLRYQQTKKIFLQGMGIIIQTYKTPKHAGVMFTGGQRPGTTTSRPAAEWLVEYVNGFAGDLVSGKATPGRIVITNHDRWEVLTRPTNGQNQPEANWIKDLTQVGKKIDASLQQVPQDIEWLVDENDHIQIVQTRPVTKPVPSFKTDISTATPYQILHQTAILWSNANLNENYPEPICPLLYSIARKAYYYYFKNLGLLFGVSRERIEKMELSLAALVGTHQGTLYYNLSNIYQTLAVLPFGAHIAGFFNVFVGVKNRNARLKKIKQPVGFYRQLQDALSGTRIFLKMGLVFVSLPWRVRTFNKMMNKHLQICRNSQQTVGDETTLIRTHLEDFSRFQGIRFDKWKTAAPVDVASAFSFGILKSLLKNWLPAPDTDQLISHLLGGISDLPSHQPPVKLWALAQSIKTNAHWLTLFAGKADAIWKTLANNPGYYPLKEKIDAYCNAYGYRCSGELLLTKSNYQEDPLSLIKLIQHYLTDESPSPADRLAQQKATQQKTYAEILKKLGKSPTRRLFSFRVWVFKGLLSWMHQSIYLRELVRMRQAELYAYLRKTTLVLGEILTKRQVLNTADDIFFLEIDEVTHYFSGIYMFPSALKDLIQLRKNQNKQDAGEPLGETLITQYSFYQPVNKKQNPTGTAYPNDSDIFSGTAVSPGIIKGRASILEDIHNLDTFQSGSLLVTKQTDPGWAPIFPLIGGLVVERGGMLSHGAIIAREFNIPAVIGIDKITQKLKTGQRIEIDGDQGLVKKFN